ncbi:hypothetical protein FHT87_004588 [Rhizobium sp. BK316]|uniref:hypothetical protein n=1 Tax=Rhizobium sp. BK316 TaxID=2587053 RepID=UPI00161902DA|nr:hypothetical protein [Rhizobium sp. BK316]MBB3410656.1 hypothetical protein [Rhizobium sp. BK316]
MEEDVYGNRMSAGPTIDEMETWLDRLASEIIAVGEQGYKLVPLYEWLEEKIEERRKVSATLERARFRVERKAEKVGTTVGASIRGGPKQKKPGSRRK